MVKDLSREEFLEVIKDIESTNSDDIKKITIIEFYMDTCPHCIAMSPIMESISNEYPQIDVYKMEISDNREIAISFNVDATPTFIFFTPKGSKKTVVGEMSKNDLKSKINDIFNI